MVNKFIRGRRVSKTLAIHLWSPLNIIKSLSPSYYPKDLKSFVMILKHRLTSIHFRLAHVSTLNNPSKLPAQAPTHQSKAFGLQNVENINRRTKCWWNVLCIKWICHNDDEEIEKLLREKHTQSNYNENTIAAFLMRHFLLVSPSYQH